MNEMQEQINRLETKVDSIFTSVEKMRKYFKVTMWITIAMVVLPILGILIVVPMIINVYSSLF